MKNILKFILKYYLKYVTKLLLFIRRPIIIAIAGSTNKTFTRDAVVNGLINEGVEVISSSKSFNTEIGLPLAILGLPSGYNSYKKWLPIMWLALTRLWSKNFFSKVIVLEFGISRPGDMKYLLSIANPNIVVITEITQRYLDSFSDMDHLVGEYEYLVAQSSNCDLFVLNYDNPRVRRLAEHSRKSVDFFSLCYNEQKANIDNLWQTKDLRKNDSGLSFVICNKNRESSIFIKCFGNHHISAEIVKSIIIKKIDLLK